MSVVDPGERATQLGYTGEEDPGRVALAMRLLRELAPVRGRLPERLVLHLVVRGGVTLTHCLFGQCHESSSRQMGDFTHTYISA